MRRQVHHAAERLRAARSPRLSSRITSTLGAPAGALTSKIGGALALRASISVIAGSLGSAIGSTVRSSGCLTVFKMFFLQ